MASNQCHVFELLLAVSHCFASTPDGW